MVAVVFIKSKRMLVANKREKTMSGEHNVSTFAVVNKNIVHVHRT